MQARPAKPKLVKLARACLPPGREPNSRPGAVTTVTLAIQVAAQIGYVRVSKAARITEGYLYRPGCRPVMAAVSCRARAEHLGLAGSCRRGLLMGVQIAGKDIGTVSGVPAAVRELPSSSARRLPCFPR